MALTMLPPQNSGGVEYNMKAEDKPQHEEHMGLGRLKKAKHAGKNIRGMYLKTYKNLDYNKKMCLNVQEQPRSHDRTPVSLSTVTTMD